MLVCVIRFFFLSCNGFIGYGTVKRFATDVVAPKVREMDENENMDPSIIQGLFEQGVSLPIGIRMYHAYSHRLF